MKYVRRLQLQWNLLKEGILLRKKMIIFCFVAVFFWGFFAHAYGFLHNNLSHDVLNAFTATRTEEIWKIELGRFLVPVYRLIRGPVSLPWLVGLLGLMWTAIALFLVVEIFDISSRVAVFLTAGIMTTNITYIAQIATYLYEFDFNALSMLLAVLAVYLWNRKEIFWNLAAVCCLMVSIAIYQAYISVTVTLIVWKSIMDLLDDKPVMAVLIHGLKGILVVLTGVALYFGLGKFVYAITGIVPQDRTNVFEAGSAQVQLNLEQLQEAFEEVKSYILHKAYNIRFFKKSATAVTVLSCVTMVAVFVRKRYRWDRILMVFALIVALPIAMDCMRMLSKAMGIHELMVYAVWFFYVFLVVFSFFLCGKDWFPRLWAKLLRVAVCALVCVVLWQNVLLANTAYVKKELEANATLSVMTRVAATWDAREDFDPEETEVAFIGDADTEVTVHGMKRVSSILAMHKNFSIFRDDSEYYYNTYKAYFEYVLQRPVRFCSDEVHAQLKEDERVQALPKFPQKGYMEMIDGMLVIKMG